MGNKMGVCKPTPIVNKLFNSRGSIFTPSFVYVLMYHIFKCVNKTFGKPYKGVI